MAKKRHGEFTTKTAKRGKPDAKAKSYTKASGNGKPTDLSIGNVRLAGKGYVVQFHCHLQWNFAVSVERAKKIVEDLKHKQTLSGKSTWITVQGVDICLGEAMAAQVIAEVPKLIKKIENSKKQATRRPAIGTAPP